VEEFNRDEYDKLSAIDLKKLEQAYDNMRPNIMRTKEIFTFFNGNEKST